jgi:tight adherence protein B
MFSDGVTMLALVVLVALSSGAIAYATLFRRVNSETTVAKRLNALSTRTPVASDRRSLAEIGARRKNIQDSIKEFDAKQKAVAKQMKTPPLSLRMQQAGLSWTKRTYYIVSGIAGLAFGVLGLVASGQLYIGLGVAVIAGFGLPRWFIAFRRKGRMAKFMNELPNAVDVIVRGIKSGLPLGDCLRIIATEAAEPVRSEFRIVVETQTLGVTITDAVAKLYERMPAQEVNFFATVIAIQAKAGGNLSEALSNLSRVLRDRKKMKAKINAMSMEAKSSAGIIGSLPFIVTILVYLTSPDYIMLLFITRFGNILLIGGLLYMFIGILVMRKMINFDF